MQNVLLWTFARLFDWVITLLLHDAAVVDDRDDDLYFHEFLLLKASSLKRLFTKNILIIGAYFQTHPGNKLHLMLVSPFIVETGGFSFIIVTIVIICHRIY